MKTKIPSVKGARDFYPEQLALRNWLLANMRFVSELYGYQEYDGPFLEYLDLYAAKSGEELVREQSFVFQDRGGEWITLRPELTPSLARMVAQRQGELSYPLRWWSFGPMWRYERPQKGRSREFFQWNVDLIGADTPEADAELVSLAALYLKQCGLKPDQIQIKVNNRRLLDSQLAALGIEPEKRPAVFKLIDRRDKLSAASWEAYAKDEIGLSTDQLTGIRDLISNQNLWKESPDLCRFFAALAPTGVAEYITFAPDIVRGLEYYTGTVFEAWDNDGEFRAILGGGRYDNLVGDVGGEPLSGVGFAMGDMVIGLVLEKFGLIPADLLYQKSPVLVTVFDLDSLPTSIQLAAQLRAAGIPAICYPDAAKLSKQFKFADRIKAPAVLVIGPDERASNQITLKNLLAREQAAIPQSDIVPAVRKILAHRAAS